MTSNPLRDEIAGIPRYQPTLEITDETSVSCYMVACAEGYWISRPEVLAILDAHPEQPKDNTELVEALRPFAEFAEAVSFNKLPDDMPMTQGSRLARRQVTAGDFKRANAALSPADSKEGE